MEEVYNYLIGFGFKREDIDKIIKIYVINKMTPNIILKHTNEDIDYFFKNGYNKSQIIKMIIKFPQILCLNIENIKQKIEDIVSLGYTKEIVIKMTIVIPALFSYSFEQINQKLDYLISLGYSRTQALEITKLFPSIFGYNSENIKQKIEDIMSLGYTQEKVIKMILELPALFGLSFENISNKINYYREINFDFYVTEHPKNLMQSVELSYARYNYFKNNNIGLKSHKCLFYGEKQFTKKFNITKLELLQMYPYKNKEGEIKDAR